MTDWFDIVLAVATAAALGVLVEINNKLKAIVFMLRKVHSFDTDDKLN